VGTAARATLDLNVLADLGVELLGSFDAYAGRSGRDAEVGPTERFPPSRAAGSPRWQLDLGSGEISTIVWATAGRPDHSWLDVPVLDEKGRLRHDAGWSTARVCTPSACRSCDGDVPPSCTASTTTPAPWSSTSAAGSTARAALGDGLKGDGSTRGDRFVLFSG